MRVDICVPDSPVGEIASHMAYRKLGALVRDPDKVDKNPGDIVLNFLSPYIFKNKALEVPNMNFHPAPPQYPGRGGASRALEDKSHSYGATAHKMVKKVDAGEIYFVHYFCIQKHDTCASIFARAETECLSLLARAIDCILMDDWPKPLLTQWGESMTRKQFEEWMKTASEDALAHPWLK